MRVGPTLWANGILGTQRHALDAEGKRMAQLFDIICQNFESNMDSMLGLHEDISSRHVGPTYLEELCSAWKEFLDSLPTPRIALQSPSRSSWTGRPQEKQHQEAGHSPRCLLWYKSSHKVVLMASSSRICHEDCLLMRDYIQFLHRPQVASRPQAAVSRASIDAVSAHDLQAPVDSAQEGIRILISSGSESVESSFAGGSAIGVGHASSCLPDTVYLGQIDDRTGAFAAGKQKFRLHQKILFEDNDDFCILQSLFECKSAEAHPDAPPDSSSARGSVSEKVEEGDYERDSAILFAAVEKFKKKLAKSFPSNPYSIFALYNMETHTMEYPGLVQFLCINRYAAARSSVST